VTLTLQILEELFPSELMEYFTITSFKTLLDSESQKNYYLIEFEEKNVIPDGYLSRDFESKGFVKSKQIQDFPLRGKPVFLKIKKRRWRNKTTKEIIKRDFTFIADGSKFTQELSDFLKDRNR